MQVVQALGQDALGRVVARLHQPLDLGVDDLGGLFRDVLGAADRVAQEHLFLVVAVGDEAQLVGIAPADDHVAGEARGRLDVAGSARGDLVLAEDQFLGDPASHHDRQA